MIGDPPDTYALYIKSLELEVQRSGPILGAFIHYWLDRYEPPQEKLSYTKIYRR